MPLLPDSFRHRLALLFGTLAICVVLPVYLYVRHVYTDQLLAERQAALQERATAIATIVAENLRERQREIEYLAEMQTFPQGRLSTEQLRRHLEGLQKSHPYYSWIGQANAQGIVQAATGNILLGVNVQARPWFQEGLKGNFVGDLHEAVLLSKKLPHLPGNGPIRFIDFAAPVFDNHGQLQGVLAAHAHWRWAGEVIQAMAPPIHGLIAPKVYIVNRLGQVIYPEADGNTTLQTTPDFLMGVAQVHDPIPETPLGWQIVVRQSRQEARSQVGNLENFLRYSVLVAGTLFLLLAWWSANLIARPLQMLADQARRIAQGEEHQTLSVGNKSREILMLVNALRDMANHLISGKEALARNNEALESKVRERTAALETLNQELRQLARRDALTGLPNRLAATERLGELFAQMQRHAQHYTVMLLDVDFFKRVNDTYGHAIGDAVLRTVADCLRQALREGDFVGRFGGEEFIVLLPEASLNTAVVVAEKLRQTVAAATTEGCGSVTISLGVALSHADDVNEDNAVSRADEFLYAAKHAGRNCVVWQPGETSPLTNDVSAV